MDEEIEGYGLIVSFPDQSPSFAHGFEAGTIWQMIEAGVSRIERTIHAANEEVVRRMCVARGYAITVTPCKDEAEHDYPTYRVVTLHKEKAAPERPNPHGLRIIGGREEGRE